jgi:hypothetical protein
MATSLDTPCLIVYHVSKAGGESLHKWFADNKLKLWTHYGHKNDSFALKYASDRMRGVMASSGGCLHGSLSSLQHRKFSGGEAEGDEP